MLKMVKRKKILKNGSEINQIGLEKNVKVAI